jgi:hypothetical protein
MIRGVGLMKIAALITQTVAAAEKAVSLRYPGEAMSSAGYDKPQRCK